MSTGLTEWSEGMYLIHGYTKGEVVPTVELVLSHKHPRDRDAARQLIQALTREGGQGSNFHRILDSKGHEHRVLTVAEAERDETGKLSAFHGLTTDLTRAIAVESGRAAAEALVNAYATRGIIEQAKGIIMGYFNVGPSEAFDRLAEQSQNTNIKVAILAAQLLAAAEELCIHEVLGQWPAPRAARQGSGRPTTPLESGL